MAHRKQSFWYRNSLSIVLVALLFIFWGGQVWTGLCQKNEELLEHGKAALSLGAYLNSGHFYQATFENWESEFLQMSIYVLLTISLRQKGSSESKSLTEKEPVDREPMPHKKAPWPVKKGGIWLKIYQNSLSIALGILFLLSFALHFRGSLQEANEELADKGQAIKTWQEYITGSRFWFESFQNWQSEFLAVAAIVLLSIWLRQKGSPESKPVDASNDETGN